MYVTGNRNAARKGGKRMAEILAEIYSWISFVPKITFKNLIEIAIIAILVYEMLIWDQKYAGVDASEGYCFYSCILSGSCDPGTGYDSVASGKDVVHCGNGDHRYFPAGAAESTGADRKPERADDAVFNG